MSAVSFSVPSETLDSFVRSADPGGLILADALSECGVVLPDDPAGIDAVCGEISGAALAGWRGESLPVAVAAPTAAVQHAHVCGAAVAVALGWRFPAVLAILSAAGVSSPRRRRVHVWANAARA